MSLPQLNFLKRCDFAIFEREPARSAHDIKYYFYEGFLVDKCGYRVSYSQEDYDMMKERRRDFRARFLDIEGNYCYDGIKKQYLDWQELEERRINFLNQLLPEEQDNGSYYILTYSFCETREVYSFNCVLCNDETCEIIELSITGLLKDVNTEELNLLITYLGHSGFLIEFHRCYCIFDYYTGKLPCLNPEKPVFVLVSHAHADHYNPHIFELLHGQGMTDITAVLSKDIPQQRRPEGISLHIVTFHQSYELPCDIFLQTLHSTDRGVAYLLKHDSYVIYHAGDLNDWSFDPASPQYQEQQNRQMAGSYRHEIDLLDGWLGGASVDAAFLPLDPRLGTHYANGLLYFLKKISVKKVYPMHYWDRPDIIARFLEEYPHTPLSAALLPPPHTTVHCEDSPQAPPQ